MRSDSDALGLQTTVVQTDGNSSPNLSTASSVDEPRVMLADRVSQHQVQQVSSQQQASKARNQHEQSQSMQQRQQRILYRESAHDSSQREERQIPVIPQSQGREQMRTSPMSQLVNESQLTETSHHQHRSRILHVDASKIAKDIHQHQQHQLSQARIVHPSANPPPTTYLYPDDVGVVHEGSTGSFQSMGAGMESGASHDSRGMNITGLSEVKKKG